MPNDPNEVERIARQAVRLVGNQRDSFLTKMCSGNRQKLEIVYELIRKLEAQPYPQPSSFDVIGASSDLKDTLLVSDEARVINSPVEPQQRIINALAQDPLKIHDENSTPTTKATEKDASPGGNIRQSHERDDEIGAACENFGKAWLSETSPTITDFIPKEIDEDVRQELVLRLVMLDMAYRDEQGLNVSEELYLKALPDCKPVIQSALTKRSKDVKSRNRVCETIVYAQSSEARHSGETPLPGSDRYEPIRLHAKGGLGAIYFARDKELRRMVALKRILPAHERNDGSRMRFTFEAEVTGSLEHPGIVPVYGFGSSADGTPYYAMKFIRGESLTAAIKEFHRIHSPLQRSTFYGRDFRLLLRKFIDVCNAMSYAHERGVLHRDLKPDNVMLGKFGETLVVDWGLAKLMAQPRVSQEQGDISLSSTLPLRGPSGSGSQTTLGQVVGTPVYMSAEQAQGLNEELTPASDIYSLGAMLFNIISNQYSVEGSTPSEVIASARSGKVRSLKSVINVAPGALNSICCRAMNREPTGRYATAGELADDVDRWLGDEPVLAHKGAEGFAEKFGRLTRRYRDRTLSGALGLLAVAIVSIAAAVVIQRSKLAESTAKAQEARAKEEAIRRYQQSRQSIDTWLVQSSDLLQFFPSTQALRLRLLEAAAGDYQSLSLTESPDPAIELERGRITIRLGDIQQMMLQSSKAKEQYSRALSIVSPLIQQADPKVRQLASLEVASALLKIGLSEASSGFAPNAMQYYQRAIEHSQPLLESSMHSDAARLLAQAHSSLAECQLLQNRIDDASEHLNAANKVMVSIKAQATVADWRQTSQIAVLQARVFREVGDGPAARSTIESSVSQLSRLAIEHPDDPVILESLASSLVTQANIQRSLGDLTGEIQSLQDAVSHYSALVRSVPDMPNYIEQLALTLSDLGLAQIDREHCKDALSPLEDAFKLMADLVYRYGSIPRYQNQIAATQDALGQAKFLIGETSAALANCAAAVRVYEELFQSQPEQLEYLERLAIAMSHHAQAAERAAGSKQFESAIELLKRVVENEPHVPRFRASLGYIYYEAGLAANDSDIAKKYFIDALACWDVEPELEPQSAERRAWLLATCPVAELVDFDKARQVALKIVAALPSNTKFRSTLALSQIFCGRLDEAQATVQELRKHQSLLSARELLTIAYVYRMSGDRIREKEYYALGGGALDEQSKLHPDLLYLESLFSESANSRD